MNNSAPSELKILFVPLPPVGAGGYSHLALSEPFCLLKATLDVLEWSGVY
jgi:hypothetical protein